MRSQAFALVVLGLASCGLVENLGSNADAGADAGVGDSATPGSGDGRAFDGGAEGSSWRDAEADSGVVLYGTHFEGPNECDEWTVTGGVVTTVPGYTGNGCMLCATATEENVYMRREIAPRAALGAYRESFRFKLVSDRIMAQSSYSFWQPDGSPTLGSGGPVGSGAVVPIGWTFGGLGLSNFLPGYVPPDPALGYYLAGVEFSRDVLLEAGDCVIFDDLQIIYSPELGTGP
ncbi:hypothetical protein BH11MYX4_BH11MYX4_22890 [soil metagenome]